MKPGIQPGQPFHFAPPCRKCGHVGGSHSLRCPRVNLLPGWYERVLLEDDDGDPD